MQISRFDRLSNPFSWRFLLLFCYWQKKWGQLFVFYCNDRWIVLYLIYILWCRVGSRLQTTSNAGNRSGNIPNPRIMCPEPMVGALSEEGTTSKIQLVIIWSKHFWSRIYIFITYSIGTQNSCYPWNSCTVNQGHLKIHKRLHKAFYPSLLMSAGQSLCTL